MLRPQSPLLGKNEICSTLGSKTTLINYCGALMRSRHFRELGARLDIVGEVVTQLMAFRASYIAGLSNCRIDN